MEKLLSSVHDAYLGFLYHYYRAEVYRETNWRGRLDVTTNWAIVTTAAILTFVFSSDSTHHTIILLNYLIVLFFLFIEARRFRYYSLLKKRTRQIEEQVLAPLFSEGKFGKSSQETWYKDLCESLVRPQIPMSRRESIAWRLRRNYILLLFFIFIVWFVKLSFLAQATGNTTFLNVIAQGAIWFIPGGGVFLFLLASLLFFLGIALYFPEHSLDDDLP